MNYRLLFPQQAAFGKKIPKQKIYEHGKASASLKRIFINDIDKITWEYKLSPTTINIPAKEYIQELQVISLQLRNDDVSNAALLAIDKAVPSPIIFCLNTKTAVQYAAAYKRPSEGNASRWVIGDYQKTAWIQKDAEIRPLPIALNLASLYHMLLKDFSSVSEQENESIDDHLTRTKQADTFEKQLVRLSSRLQREKQFNRKVELNSQIKRLQKELFSLRNS